MKDFSVCLKNFSTTTNKTNNRNKLITTSQNEFYLFQLKSVPVMVMNPKWLQTTLAK